MQANNDTALTTMAKYAITFGLFNFIIYSLFYNKSVIKRPKFHLKPVEKNQRKSNKELFFVISIDNKNLHKGSCAVDVFDNCSTSNQAYIYQRSIGWLGIFGRWQFYSGVAAIS
ncbi:hypothetical protein T4B_5159 [Trichinella pseudospiralis]|uniref:Uncharacterized protein n=1 Tax=Trichinella pseudospiralis TaxID=6337 RepID=A0A0V1IQ21_TRIPS|nr:hypothetical protein T4B_5159 [Trichinella pseudospiralis]